MWKPRPSAGWKSTPTRRPASPPSHRRTQATPEMLLGTAVVNGDSPAFGFTPETYLIAPSLRVYELFMWYDENERWTRN